MACSNVPLRLIYTAGRLVDILYGSNQVAVRADGHSQARCCAAACERRTMTGRTTIDLIVVAIILPLEIVAITKENESK